MRSHQLADDYYAIGAEINHFSELLKITEIPQIVSMYKRLSNLIIRNGDFTIQSGELMNQQLSAQFKVYRQESKSFQEAHWLRDESLARYNAQRNDLAKRKEKLFKRKDVTEWGCPATQMRDAMNSLNNAEEAFEFMLPNATKQVNYLAEESAFFTSQAYKEARRVTMINYTMARENMVDLGEQMHRHIYEMTLNWGHFLDFYSDLNNARKEKDEEYVEKSFIGEELMEPDEQPIRNNDLIDDYAENVEGLDKDFYDQFDDGFAPRDLRGSLSLDGTNQKDSSYLNQQNILTELQ